MQVSHLLLSLHHPNSCFENIYIFLIDTPKTQQPKLFLGRKNIGGRGTFVPLAPPPPSYAYDDDYDKKTMIMMMTTSVLGKENTQL